VSDRARKDKLVHRAATPFEPGQQTRPGIGKPFELDGATCFPLHHDCACSDLPAADKVADFHLHEVASAQLAVDHEGEQRPIS